MATLGMRSLVLSAVILGALPGCMRRALQLLADPPLAQPFLASIATAETRHAAGE